MADLDKDSRHPVTHVSWNDAKAMAKWLSKENDMLFRLPSEAEWEYVCRAGTKTTRFWGDTVNDACNYANAADRKVQQQFRDLTIHNCNDGYTYTSPVMSFSANRFGLYDVLGNVWEWCEDIYDENYYDESPENSPKGPSKGNFRVMRGGFWGSKPSDLRCANRSREAPQGRSDTYGFRLVIVPSH
jgi:formylglycine-generating enzyme required for sulfatase activity